MATKLLVIIGAGATLSDAMSRSKLKRPPLDKGFFGNCRKPQYAEFDIVRSYLSTTYGFDPTEPERDSLEAVMGVIYADIHNPRLGSQAVEAFRALIRLFNRRLADTTNDLVPTNRFRLYKILCKELDDKLSPHEICIVTFNQDLQIEKTLFHIQATARGKQHGRILNFPFCYGIANPIAKLTGPTGNAPVFPSGVSSDPVLHVLKLHGSLNWYSSHVSRQVPKNSILDSTKRFRISRRRAISSNLTYSGGMRRMHAFPLVVPPVAHKSGILHRGIHVLWRRAETALREARRVVIFGYSCPPLDFESANLIRRGLLHNENIEEFSVIDPDPAVFQRYIELTGLGRLYYFRNADEYLSAV